MAAEMGEAAGKRVKALARRDVSAVPFHRSHVSPAFLRPAGNEPVPDRGVAVSGRPSAAVVRIRQERAQREEMSRSLGLTSPRTLPEPARAPLRTPRGRRRQAGIGVPGSCPVIVPGGCSSAPSARAPTHGAFSASCQGGGGQPPKSPHLREPDKVPATRPSRCAVDPPDSRVSRHSST
jgi:hypothetical protein